MENEVKEKTKLEIIKELWKNPKTHAIIVLGFWLIFIGILILFLKISSITKETAVNPESVSPLDKFNKMTSYEFNYTANDLSLNGLYYQDKYLLYLDNQKYYKSNALYKISDNIELSEEIEILKLNNKMLYNLIKDITPVQNNEYNSYLVPLMNFIKEYENINVTDYNLATYNIVVNVYQKNDTINKVIIDLTNYYKYKQLNIDSYILNISYYNINNLSDFTKEYEEMIGEK